MKEKSNNEIKLVQTDYNNLKNLKLAIAQQEKAEAMLNEVAKFKHSFALSKLIKIEDLLLQPNYNWINYRLASDLSHRRRY